MKDWLKRSFQMFSPTEKIGIGLFIITLAISAFFIFTSNSPSQKLMDEKDEKLALIDEEIKKKSQKEMKEKSKEHEIALSTSSTVVSSDSELLHIAQSFDNDFIQSKEVKIEGSNIVVEAHLENRGGHKNYDITINHYSDLSKSILEKEQDFEYLTVRYLPVGVTIKINRLYAIPNPDKELHFPSYLIKDYISFD